MEMCESTSEPIVTNIVILARLLSAIFYRPDEPNPHGEAILKGSHGHKGTGFAYLVKRGGSYLYHIPFSGPSLQWTASIQEACLFFDPMQAKQIAIKCSEIESDACEVYVRHLEGGN